MKKYYFIVLTALLTFALNLNAQENEEQETYNMTVTLPDGTTVTVNTEDVNEITFANGKLNVTGTSIDEIVQNLRLALDRITENTYWLRDVTDRSEKALMTAQKAQASADAAQASADAAQQSADMAIKEAQDARMTAADAKMMAEDATYHLANVEVKVAELENRVSYNDENVQTIKTQLVLLSNTNNYLEAMVNQLEAENRQLDAAVVSVMTDNKILEDRLAALEEAVKRLAEVVDSMKE